MQIPSKIPFTTPCYSIKICNSYGIIHSTLLRLSPYTRFIPVPTGNTTLTINVTPYVPVHPRTHGEHIVFLFGALLSGGSSPYPRGTLNSSLIAALTVRFIPVPTGNTRALVADNLSSTVHPRTHGEHLTPYERQKVSVGSSPYPRGTPRN